MVKSSQLQQTEISEEVRQFVFDRDGWYCQNPDCNSHFNLTLHHICPRSHIGSGKNPCNLVVLCSNCHAKVYQIVKKYPEFLVNEEKDLIHRFPVAFYDHEFKENFIKCSHENLFSKSK